VALAVFCAHCRTRSPAVELVTTMRCSTTASVRVAEAVPYSRTVAKLCAALTMAVFSRLVMPSVGPWQNFSPVAPDGKV
jgi:hypothetical protein